MICFKTTRGGGLGGADGGYRAHEVCRELLIVTGGAGYTEVPDTIVLATRTQA